MRKSFPDYNISSSPSKIEHNIILPRRSEQDSTLRCSAAKRRQGGGQQLRSTTRRHENRIETDKRTGRERNKFKKKYESNRRGPGVQ